MYTCSYCSEGGHSINKCKHPDIEKLQDKIQKNAVIHYYCMLKYDFNFLLYSLKLLTIPELQIISYKNKLDNKLSYKPNKLELRKYIYFLVEYFSFENKESITIPYFDNNILWDYATVIHSLTHKKEVILVYMDIIKISPRPFFYDIDLELVKSIEHNDMNNNYKCSICFESMIDLNICLINCKHSFCSNCIKMYLVSLYKYSNDYNNYKPNCPLCRTDISTILMNDYDSYHYFSSTFIEEFTPDYFNSINEASIVKIHNYENKFYYSENIENIENIENNEEYNIDEEEGFGPYNFRIHLPRNIISFTYLQNFIIENITIIINMTSIIQYWFFFMGIIYIVHVCSKHEKEPPVCDLEEIIYI